ncbi:DUF637 domain-containing protein, partial [Paraburkholderia sp. RCC_158]|uniref:DUF637 domain-containing protein n=1 Tax=Paraburkholderia sp. RCC_158 TaxID=3239220 RepID=UPI00352323D8
SALSLSFTSFCKVPQHTSLRYCNRTQLASGNGLSFGSMLEAGVVGALTAGAFSALGAGSQGLQQIGSKIANGTATMADVGQALVSIGERGLVNAGVSTAVYGGSFGNALENSVISDVGAIGAAVIGAASTDKDSVLAEKSPGYVLAHAGLGCALSAAEGNGCAGGAIGGAASAIIAPVVRDALYDGSEKIMSTQYFDGSTAQTTIYDNSVLNALTAGAATLLGGAAAGMAGQNVLGAVSGAENEVLNNTMADKTRNLMNHGYDFVTQLANGTPLNKQDLVDTLAGLTVAENDPNLSPTERLNITGAKLAAYNAGINAGVQSSNNVGALISAAIGSMAFSGGGDGPMLGAGRPSNVLPTTTGSRTAVPIGAATSATNSLGMPIGETSLTISGKTGTFEFAGTQYPLQINPSGSTAATNVDDPQTSAFSLLQNLSGGAAVVAREVSGGTLYQATNAVGQTYTLRPFSTTSAQTGIPEWTLQGPSGSLPGGVKEIKLRGL